MENSHRPKTKEKKNNQIKTERQSESEHNFEYKMWNVDSFYLYKWILNTFPRFMYIFCNFIVGSFFSSSLTILKSPNSMEKMLISMLKIFCLTDWLTVCTFSFIQPKNPVYQIKYHLYYIKVVARLPLFHSCPNKTENENSNAMKCTGSETNPWYANVNGSKPSSNQWWE